jgi:hypothetical protein
MRTTASVDPRVQEFRPLMRAASRKPINWLLKLATMLATLGWVMWLVLLMRLPS